MKTKLKLTLVVPNLRWCEGDENTFWHFIPYNLCLLAAMVENDCEVEILDAYAKNLTPEGFTLALKESNPDVVGITVMMDQFAEAGHIAVNLAKSYNPKVTVIMGGVYVTVNPLTAMQDKQLDYAIIGEGEYVLKDLIRYFKGGKTIPDKGICFRKNGEIVNTGRAEFIEDLNSLPLPAYHLIDFRSYSKSAERKSVDSPSEFPYARIQTSRGCPQKCTFCQVMHISGRTFRPRSAENVLKEILWLKDKFNVKSLIFDDDNLYTHKKRAVAVFKGMIESGLVMPWVSISTAVFKLDEELIMLMRKSGCNYICVAIESGSKRVLKEVVKKPVNLERAKKLVEMARKAGIYVAANFIVGFPTETWDEIRQTVKFAEDLNADYIKLFAAMPLRNTQLWDMCEENDAFKEGFDSKNLRWSTGQIETKDFTADDLTILRAYEWDRINFSDAEKRKKTAQMMKISENELLKVRRRTLLNSQKNICRNATMT